MVDMIDKLLQQTKLKISPRLADGLRIACLICAIGFLCLLLIPAVIFRAVVRDDTVDCSSRFTAVRSNGADQCISEPYTAGEVCRQTLTSTQGCALGRNFGEAISVNATGSQATKSKNLTNFLDVIAEHNGSQQCRDAMLPFMCQYTFPLCDNNTKQLYLPTQERCIEISEHVCTQEWNLTRQLGYQNLLPNCTTLISGLKNVTCLNDFINLNGSCSPRCDSFEYHSHSVEVLHRIVTLLSAIVAIVSGTAFLVASAVHYKQMFSFPLILLVYMTIEIVIFGVVLLITESGSPSLLCSFITIDESIANPTILCIISGAVYNYTVVGIHIFWSFHVGFFFYKIMCPFHANAHKSEHKYIHLGMVIFGFLSPLPAVIIALTVDGYEYSLNQFPPTLCYSSNSDHFFYSIAFIVNFLLVVSSVLLAIIIFKLHKNKSLSKSEGRQPLLSTAEKKLLVILSVYVTSALLNVVAINIAQLRTRSQISMLTQYFACESNGHVPGKCFREQTSLFIWLSSILLILFGLLPALNLFFLCTCNSLCLKRNSTVKPPGNTIVMQPL